MVEEEELESELLTVVPFEQVKRLQMLGFLCQLKGVCEQFPLVLLNTRGDFFRSLRFVKRIIVYNCSS